MRNRAQWGFYKIILVSGTLQWLARSPCYCVTGEGGSLLHGQWVDCHRIIGEGKSHVSHSTVTSTVARLCPSASSLLNSLGIGMVVPYTGAWYGHVFCTHLTTNHNDIPHPWNPSHRLAHHRKRVLARSACMVLESWDNLSDWGTWSYWNSVTQWFRRIRTGVTDDHLQNSFSNPSWFDHTHHRLHIYQQIWRDFDGLVKGVKGLDSDQIFDRIIIVEYLEVGSWKLERNQRSNSIMSLMYSGHCNLGLGWEGLAMVIQTDCECKGVGWHQSSESESESCNQKLDRY